MKLSKNMKQLLIDELNFIIKKMKESEAAQEKMYFFSAAHGMVNRIMNLEFNNLLTNDLFQIPHLPAVPTSHLGAKIGFVSTSVRIDSARLDRE
jgi:hypothetical protein